jgi:5-methylcytosine-specific restriction endonuclease McrA
MPRDYKKELAYESTTEQKAKRAARGRARYALEKKVGASALKGKDVDHKKAISKGGSNKLSNLRAVSPSKNRSFDRNSDGSMKHNFTTKKK